MVTTTSAKERGLQLINVYAPLEDKNDLVTDEFYNNLESLCDSMPSGNVMMCDFDAKVEKSWSNVKLLPEIVSTII